MPDQSLKQAKRFVVVGLVANLALYLAYLALTFIGMSPYIAFSLIYVVGVCSTFFVHSRFTFEQSNKSVSQFSKYLVLYIAGYFLALFSLYVLVDLMHIDHRLAQAINIVWVASINFVLQKLWVFN